MNQRTTGKNDNEREVKWIKSQAAVSLRSKTQGTPLTSWVYEAFWDQVTKQRRYKLPSFELIWSKLTETEGIKNKENN